jgi:phenylalanyl-tRNA synthetase beta chain
LPDSVIPKAFADGIFLTKEGTPGAPFQEVIGSDEAVLEIEVTPNRPDCLSVIGMARESAATFQTELRLPEGKEEESFGAISDYLTDIRLESDECIRYMGRVIHDVVIEPSPQWMQNRLMQAGMRPINNIVDITNYVMLEMGVPLHAFDIDTVKDKTIVVRRAEEGETLLLLNGTEKVLTDKDLIIADSKDPIGIGMGFNFFYMACYNPRYGFSQRSDGIHMRSAVGNSVGKGYRTYRNIRILL